MSVRTRRCFVNKFRGHLLVRSPFLNRMCLALQKIKRRRGFYVPPNDGVRLEKPCELLPREGDSHQSPMDLWELHRVIETGTMKPE